MEINDYLVGLRGLFTIEFIMVGLWVLSRKLKDVSIVDIFWGLGFVILSWVYYLSASGKTLLIPLLTSIWGTRLAFHIYSRNKGQGEDRRYTAMRKNRANFELWSLFAIFLFQGALLWTIAMPLLFSQIHSWSWEPIVALGLLIWVIGFLFEAVGDYQLMRFKQNTNNAGKVLDSGLWKYTRHPNYFGDSFLWWGFGTIAFGLGASPWVFVSPLLMTFFLLKVSGVSLLEKNLTQSKPQYRDYIRKTSAFIPWPPKK